MSGFSSLLENFKQTTQLAAAAASSSSNVSSSGTHTSRKRSHAEISETHIFPMTAVARIFIACPANVETGGPEALHQLCHVINAGEYSYLDLDDEVQITTSQDPDSITTLYAVSIPVKGVKPEFDVENETYGWDEEPLEGAPYDDDAWKVQGK